MDIKTFDSDINTAILDFRKFARNIYGYCFDTITKTQACATAMRDVIASNHVDYHLDTNTIISTLLNDFSPQRISVCLAIYLYGKSHDGRLEKENFYWAEDIIRCVKDKYDELREKGCLQPILRALDAAHMTLINAVTTDFRKYLDNDTADMTLVNAVVTENSDADNNTQTEDENAEPKVYARQIDPEYQMPYTLEDIKNDEHSGMILNGNKRFKSINEKGYRELCSYFDELRENYDDVYCSDDNVLTFSEFFTEYSEFHKPDNKPWTQDELIQWKKLIKTDDPEEPDVIEQLLYLLTGEKWGHFSIHGNCQSDWNSGYCNKKQWNNNSLWDLSVEYFNTGTEWEIYDDVDETFDENCPEQLDNYTCYSLYCHSCDEDSIRKEIADASDVSPQNVIMYGINCKTVKQVTYAKI